MSKPVILLIYIAVAVVVLDETAYYWWRKLNPNSPHVLRKDRPPPEAQVNYKKEPRTDAVSFPNGQTHYRRCKTCS